MRHSILGAGGVGGMMAACLAKVGDSVTLVVRPEKLQDYPRQVHLVSPFGEFAVEVTVAAEVPAVDVLWITVKGTQLDSAMAALKSPDSVTAIVPLLNGIDHIELLRSKYGSSRVIPATIAGEMERIAPGNIVHRSPFLRLNVASAGRPLLGHTLDELQKMGFACSFIDNEPTLLWGKLVFLAPFALSTTAADKTVGEILSDPKWRALAEACVREACAVALAEGAKVDAASILAWVKTAPGHMRSSMQKDVDRGNPPELDAIAGPILRAARRHEIEVPATKTLVEGVEQRAGLVRSIA
ncbi:MAG TPA: 2-dehydropantoate 2-reductase [Candidatus Sulfotelmatobacter sp.]|nr:2-dehydropantoate 2-reductase [Candidatus Sulfotelmatobacter sp.]